MDISNPAPTTQTCPSAGVFHRRVIAGKTTPRPGCSGVEAGVLFTRLGRLWGVIARRAAKEGHVEAQDPLAMDLRIERARTALEEVTE